MEDRIAYWKSKLDMAPHPEGGFFKEVYRSSARIDQLSVCTSIYFLLVKDGFSAFHRIPSDEIWHHYEGDPVILFLIDDKGQLIKIKVGKEEGATPQALVPGNTWFASITQGEYSLVGCTVAPGFEFDTFELADRKSLSATYPQHALLIEQLTRE